MEPSGRHLPPARASLPRLTCATGPASLKSPRRRRALALMRQNGAHHRGHGPHRHHSKTGISAAIDFLFPCDRMTTPETCGAKRFPAVWMLTPASEIGVIVPLLFFLIFAFGCPMLRRAVFATFAMALANLSSASLPATSCAYDIKPRDSASAFSAKMRPEILGISTDSTADSARAIFEAAFK